VSELFENDLKDRWTFPVVFEMYVM